MVRFAPQDTALAAAHVGVNSYSFDPTTGPGYGWHCHMVENEDNEMMRPLRFDTATGQGCSVVYLPVLTR